MKVTNIGLLGAQSLILTALLYFFTLLLTTFSLGLVQLPTDKIPIVIHKTHCYIAGNFVPTACTLIGYFEVT